MTNTDPTPQRPSATTQDGRRLVILHYHYFKNAGTTFDAILKQAFPGLWVTREFEGPLPEKARALRQWIEETPQAVCFSSHTAELPPPEIENTYILPILFIRHPLDRIRSAYEFERRQPKSTYGSQLAKQKCLAEYVEVRLNHDRQCRNFHTLRLSRMYPAKQGSELERALKALESLPFVGLVERFDESLQGISSILQEYGQGRLVLSDTKPQNTSHGSPRPLSESLQALRTDLGPELLARLEEANADDLTLYRQASSEQKSIQSKRPALL